METTGVIPPIKSHYFAMNGNQYLEFRAIILFMRHGLFSDPVGNLNFVL